MKPRINTDARRAERDLFTCFAYATAWTETHPR